MPDPDRLARLALQPIKETRRKCAHCHKALPKGSKGIHLGWSSQDGRLYLCSEKCMDDYNGSKR